MKRLLERTFLSALIALAFFNILTVPNTTDLRPGCNPKTGAILAGIMFALAFGFQIALSAWLNSNRKNGSY